LSAFDGTSVPTSEFRVEKSRTEATLTLSSGASVRGCFFVSGSSRTHSGPERVKDAERRDWILSVRMIGIAGSSTVLYNREHLVMVKLADKDEARSEPGYDVATVRIITVVLSNGTRLRGAVRVHRPHGRDRLSDFARIAERSAISKQKAPRPVHRSPRP
jgi:hypothetical protein